MLSVRTGRHWKRWQRWETVVGVLAADELEDSVADILDETHSRIL